MTEDTPQDEPGAKIFQFPGFTSHAKIPAQDGEHVPHGNVHVPRQGAGSPDFWRELQDAAQPLLQETTVLRMADALFAWEPFVPKENHIRIARELLSLTRSVPKEVTPEYTQAVTDLTARAARVHYGVPEKEARIVVIFLFVIMAHSGVLE